MGLPSISAPGAHGCGLCSSQHASLFYRYPRAPITGRCFYHCHRCGLIQVPQGDRLSAAAEKQIYDLHHNGPYHPHYRNFLSQLTTPLMAVLHANNLTSAQQPAQGLDFGSGPGPALSGILSEHGVTCVNYDIFYAHQPQRLQAQYDFVTATEVFEHLACPQQVLDTLATCLKPGGLLAIMMQRPDEQDNFANWGYIRDPTHISFYTNAALAYIADRWSFEECYRDRNVIIWQAANQQP